MIYVVNYGTPLSQIQLDTLNSLVALGTTPAGYAITKDGSGNFVNTLIPGTGQSAIQFQDEGSNLGTSGTVDTLDFVGTNVSASRVGNTVTVNISGGGGSTYNTSRPIAQVAHGFAVGDVVRHNGTIFVKAQANSDTTSDVQGLVSEVADVDNFTLLTHGYVSGLSGLTAGENYFLSATVAGQLTTTQPSSVGHVSKPLFTAVSSTTGNFINYRGRVISLEDEFTINTEEIDIGSTPRKSGKFIINTTGLTVNQPVVVTQASGPYTGKGTLTDEAQMDSVTVRAKAISTTDIECFWSSQTYVKNFIKFDYII